MASGRFCAQRDPTTRSADSIEAMKRVVFIVSPEVVV
jgi:hypothetical protein